MQRHQRRSGNGTRAGSPKGGRLFFAVALVLPLAMLAVHLHVSAFRLGYEIERLRGERAALRQANTALLCEVSGLLAPERIAERLAALGMAMVGPAGREFAGWLPPEADRLAARAEGTPPGPVNE